MDQKQSHEIWQACRLGCRLLVCLLACLIAKHSTNKPTKQQIDCDACSFVCLVMMADGLPRVECRQLLKTPGQPFFTRSRKKRRMPQSSASLRRVKNVFPEVADSCVLREGVVNYVCTITEGYAVPNGAAVAAVRPSSLPAAPNV